jgi:hypothetical protein
MGASAADPIGPENPSIGVHHNGENHRRASPTGVAAPAARERARLTDQSGASPPAVGLYPNLEEFYGLRSASPLREGLGDLTHAKRAGRFWTHRGRLVR